MNQLAIIRKHLKAVDAAFEQIKTPETLKRAGGIVREAFIRYEGFCLPELVGETVTGCPAETITMAVDALESRNVGGGSQGSLVGEKAVGGTETVVEGDVGGTFDVTTVGLVPEEVTERPPEMVGGWPVEAEIEVTGMAPNRRSLKGRLVGDGRVVSVERTIRAWKVGDTMRAKLVRAGSFPLFRMVA